jgi:hypothetical protein
VPERGERRSPAARRRWSRSSSLEAGDGYPNRVNLGAQLRGCLFSDRVTLPSRTSSGSDALPPWRRTASCRSPGCSLTDSRQAQASARTRAGTRKHHGAVPADRSGSGRLRASARDASSVPVLIRARRSRRKASTPWASGRVLPEERDTNRLVSTASAACPRLWDLRTSPRRSARPDRDRPIMVCDPTYAVDPPHRCRRPSAVPWRRVNSARVADRTIYPSATFA